MLRIKSYTTASYRFWIRSGQFLKKPAYCMQYFFQSERYIRLFLVVCTRRRSSFALVFLILKLFCKQNPSIVSMIIFLGHIIRCCQEQKDIAFPFTKACESTHFSWGTGCSKTSVRTFPDFCFVSEKWPLFSKEYISSG